MMKPTKASENTKARLRTSEPEHLSDDSLRDVTGGRRSGGQSVKYLEVKMKEVVISG